MKHSFITASLFTIALSACASTPPTPIVDADRNPDDTKIIKEMPTNTTSSTANAAETMPTGVSSSPNSVGIEGEVDAPMVGGDAVVSATPGQVSATILAGNFYYDIAQLRVQEGDTVTITMRNTEGTHDFVIDEFNVQSPVITTDEETTVTFVANKAGTFAYYCSIGSHRANGMEGTLIVEPK